MHLERRNFLAALLAAPSAVATGAFAAPAPVVVGSKLPLADLPLIDGGTFRAADASGKVLVVYWWASWCPFCAEMSPSIEKLWRTQRERGLRVLGVSIDKTAQAPLAHRQRHGYTFPSTLYSAEVERVLPSPKTVPVLWVRDRAGQIVMAERGQVFPEDVEQIARFV